ncbi:hypothetical protein Micbo1qcDRAFT_193583 [Microdochium bolleyi]|uniref:Protein-lysine N-methyltransferase EFM4 n=1 Tax=Microdochium bolleyi TaxID=196109 RepID=A0A136JB49_9PEZI|nr:hypothetical protein Micbo1qcDRAFT_193583 [Microdochium bolleyi]
MAGAQQQAQEKPAHLEPSELGTKEYWDNLYVNEISNHAHDPDDKGTVWFDDSDAEAKMIAFLNALDPDAETSDHSDDDDCNQQQRQPGNGSLPRLHQSTTTFLDLGTGNGSLLFGLRDAGWRGKMLGVDYSAKSVEFARQIARSRREEDGEDTQQGGDDVEFREYDILNGRPETLLPSTLPSRASSEPIPQQQQQQDGAVGEGEEGWDVILDKGTFDAISLYSSSSSSSSQQDDNNTTTATTTSTRRPNEGYKAAVLPLVREGGLFLITSCNWTEDELARWFEGDFDSQQQEAERQSQQWRFSKVGRVDYPSFSFGGVKGQTISTLCFMKVRG